MKLTAKERGDLADKLWVSAHSSEEVDAAWEGEIARRIGRGGSGMYRAYPTFRCSFTLAGRSAS